MKIAATYENGNIFQHFGRTETFKVYEVEDGKIVSTCSCIIIQSLAYEHRPYAIVDNIVTRSEYRAQGLATACLEEAARIAESEGCFRMMLATTSKLESTYRFYEKLGYDRNEMTAFTQWLF